MDTQELRRLLELAAKAVGFIDDATDESGGNGLHRGSDDVFYVTSSDGWREWSPTEDDGDALRLAEKCGLTVCMDGLGTVSACDERQRKEVFCTQSIKECGSRIEATRLAIVRAAAAIGEKMEPNP